MTETLAVGELTHSFRWIPILEGVENFAAHFTHSRVKLIGYHWNTFSESNMGTLDLMFEAPPGMQTVFYRGTPYRIWFGWTYFSFTLAPTSCYDAGKGSHTWTPFLSEKFLDFSYKRLNLDESPWNQVVLPWVPNLWHSHAICMPQDVHVLNVNTKYPGGHRRYHYGDIRQGYLLGIVSKFMNSFYSSSYNPDLPPPIYRQMVFAWLNTHTNSTPRTACNLGRNALGYVTGIYAGSRDSVGMMKALDDKPAAWVRRYMPMIDDLATADERMYDAYHQEKLVAHEKRLGRFSRMNPGQIQKDLELCLANLKRGVSIYDSNEILKEKKLKKATV